MFGNIQVRFLRGKGTVKSPTYLAMEFKGQVCLKKGKLVITYAKCIKARRRLEELIGYEPPAKEKIPEGRRKEIKNRFNERKQPIEGQVRLLAM